MSLCLSRSSRLPRAARASVSSSLSWSSLRSLTFLRRASMSSGIFSSSELVQLADAQRDQLALVLFLVVVVLDDLRGVDHLGGELLGHGGVQLGPVEDLVAGGRRSRPASCRRRPASGSPCGASRCDSSFGIRPRNCRPSSAVLGRDLAVLDQLLELGQPLLRPSCTARGCASGRNGVLGLPRTMATCSFSFSVLPYSRASSGISLVEVFGQLIDGHEAVRLVAVLVGGALEAVEQGRGEDAVVGAVQRRRWAGWPGRRRGRACGPALRCRRRRGTPCTACR